MAKSMNHSKETHTFRNNYEVISYYQLSQATWNLFIYKRVTDITWGVKACG